METKKSTEIQATASCRKSGLSIRIIAAVIIAAMIALFFLLPLTWDYKTYEALSNIKGSIGFCMNYSGYGFFCKFVIVVPAIWLLTIAATFISRWAARIMAIVNTVFFALFSIFMMKGVEKAYRGYLHLNLGTGFWIIAGLSIVTIVLLFLIRNHKKESKPTGDSPAV